MRRAIYGWVAQPPASGIQLFMHVAAPPHVRAQPIVQLVIWQIGVVAQVSAHELPAQSRVHEAAPVQCMPQPWVSPAFGGHFETAHVAPPVQVVEQPPPAQSSVHLVLAPSQVIAQPPPGQV